MDRVILHSDMNNFYASVECLHNPLLRGRPVAVAGDPETRHGIVLAKNDTAKKCGVQTGEPLWCAREKCRDIVFVPPHFDLYVQYSNNARAIYRQYTDRVEAFGLDECWLDVSGDDGIKLADELRMRMRMELGVTVSVGVSFNKVFAKLGSDMKKPDATTAIAKSEFRRQIWPLPVQELLYVGPATRRKLNGYNIRSIGDLARADLDFLRRQFGKSGLTLWQFANGLDSTPVNHADASQPVKSVGNSVTTPRDLVTEEDMKIVLYSLCESVSARLREYQLLCGTVQLGIKDTALHYFERQEKLAVPCRAARVLFEKAFALYKRSCFSAKPIRLLSLRAANVFESKYEQMTLFANAEQIEREERLDCMMDSIRGQFGQKAIRRGLMLEDPALAQLNPKEEHRIRKRLNIQEKPEPF